MRIYICDKCHAEEVRTNGIVGHEFDYTMQTLDGPWRTGGVVDLCPDCMKKYQRAWQDAENEKRATVVKSFQQKLKEFFA